MPWTPRDRAPRSEPRTTPGRLAKALVDRWGAAALLLLAAPWLVFIALTIWLTDDGPVLDRDRRTGRDGRPFDMLRFRTGSGHRPSTGRTRLGRFLHRSHLDELPQLLNVVRGDMSFVGPRPHPWDGTGGRATFGLKPGLIGLCGPGTDDGTNTATVEERYAREWSLRLDLVILWRALRHATSAPGSG